MPAISSPGIWEEMAGRDGHARVQDSRGIPIAIDLEAPVPEPRCSSDSSTALVEVQRDSCIELDGFYHFHLSPLRHETSGVLDP